MSKEERLWDIYEKLVVLEHPIETAYSIALDAVNYFYSQNKADNPIKAESKPSVEKEKLKEEITSSSKDNLNIEDLLSPYGVKPVIITKKGR